MMTSKYTNVLLITANVGSIFEDPNHMLKLWLKEFIATVSRLRPDFLAVHCQEVGGKNYEESMQYVNDFVKALLASEVLECYDKARVFLDEDFTAEDKFTALGNIYFIHESVKNVQIWDFTESSFRMVGGREVLSGNIESVSVKEKSKFPKEFFPECKWSRKGFIRTRWLVNNTVFDLVNIHLFHDASNFVAMESSPSSYAGNRFRALNHTLDRFAHDHLEKVPMFLFGDFNFRLDTQKLIQRLTDNTTMHSTHGKKNEISQLLYKDTHNNNPVLTIEKKAFDYHDKHLEIFASYHKWLHDYDKEVLILAERLHEFNINFPPSYPYSEDPDDGISFMKTRVPSWCDRILMNYSARDFISQSFPYDYNVIGRSVCMGDHKPVYLHIHLRQGTGKCPESADEPEPLRARSVSINGLPCAVDAAYNIHQNAKFENEAALHASFRYRMGRSATEAPQQGRELFRGVARDLVRAEGVINAFSSFKGKKRHHSESASTDDDEDETDTYALGDENSRNGVTSEMMEDTPLVLSGESRALFEGDVFNNNSEYAREISKFSEEVPDDLVLVESFDNISEEVPPTEPGEKSELLESEDAPTADVEEVDDYYEPVEIAGQPGANATALSCSSKASAPAAADRQHVPRAEKSSMCPSMCTVM